MKQRIAIILMAAVAILCTTNVIGQGCPNGYKGLKRIEAQCRVGCSYHDYNQLLGQAKTEISVCPQKSSNRLEIVLVDYEIVNELWQWKMNTYTTGFMPENHEMVRRLLKMYPQTENAIDRGGKISFLNMDLMMKIIWDEASKKLDKIKR